MIQNNEDIWRTGAFNDKRDSEIQLCGCTRFTWKGVYTVVERVSVVGSALVIVLKAGGSNHRKPSEYDLRHAAIATVIVSKQHRFRRYRKCVRTYIEYRTGVIRLVDVDRREAQSQIEQKLATQSATFHSSIMSSILALLMKQR